MSLSAKYIWLIPLLPLLSAALGTFLPRGNRSRTIASAAAILSMAVGFVLSCFALRSAIANVGTPNAHDTFNFAWLDIGNTTLQLGFLNDPLTAFMLVMVTFVGALIFIFSTGYMKEDPNAAKFFCYLSLFAAAMLGLLVANSLLLLFICWELVGLASYMLIGFWFHKPSAAAAAKKAFITTRIGDLGLLLGILWLYDSSGTLLFYNSGAGFLEANALSNLAVILPCGLALSSAIGLLIFCGAVGKSGQFPLHVWLPDAMEGPTPVSALIHAATMVAAGVFLIARVFPLMDLDQLGFVSVYPGLNDATAAIQHFSSVHALTIVAAIGAITALFGAVVAVAQNDIKRILAFSTVSQLGYMMLAIGVGAWPVAIFHLLTHAFFKALLFLGAGSVIHAAHHEQDIRNLGGLGTRMKITFATFSIGMMALAGVPFLFSGFWSKEGILHAAHGWHVSHLPFYVALIAVVLTAFYMTRLMCNVFFGKPRTHAADHAHENKLAMTLPLVLLAICAIAVGFVGTPAWPWLQSTLQNIPASEIHGHSIFAAEGISLMLTSIVLVVIGIGSGLALNNFFSKRKTPGELDPLEKLAPPIWTALANRLYFDELYAATFGKLLAAITWLSDAFDRYIFGGLVNLLGGLGEFAGGVNREFDENTINGGFDVVSEDLRKTGTAYKRAQTGDAHGYMRSIAMGFVGLLVLVILGGVL